MNHRPNARTSVALLLALAVLALSAGVRNVTGEAATLESGPLAQESDPLFLPYISRKPSPPSDTAAMVRIPVGDFQMGCVENNDPGCDGRGEPPSPTIFLDEYLIDKYEVTNARYQACVDAGVCTAPHDSSSLTVEKYYGNPTYADYPVIWVDWHQAKAFCKWEGKRLPTEAEWEKAARGTDARVYPWGSEWEAETGGTLANLCDVNCPSVDDFNKCVSMNDGYPETAPVGSYPAGASPYGVMDLVGNVAEWVHDWYAPWDWWVLTRPRNNPTGPEVGRYRVYRGGSWFSHPSHYMHFQKPPFTYTRQSASPDTKSPDIGFRCARSQ